MAANTSGFYSATSMNNIMCDGRLSFSSFIMMHADSLALSLPRTVADVEFTPVPALRRIPLIQIQIACLYREGKMGFESLFICLNRIYNQNAMFLVG